MSEGKSRQKVQQAVVQKGQIGFYPFNSLSLSALYHGQAQCMIGSREQQEMGERIRAQAEYKVGKTSVPITHKFFTGFCDAFYRGKLPELIVVAPSLTEIPPFVEELLDFIEKLASLGFLVSDTHEPDEALDRVMPLLMIASYGLVYEAILNKLKFALTNIRHFTPRQKERLLQRFSRAVFTSLPIGYDLQLSPAVLFPKPLAFNLAGTKSIYIIRATQVLDTHAAIPYQFNPSGNVGVLELELNLAHQHMCYRLFPLLRSHGVSLPCDDKQWTTAMDALGCKIGILPGLLITLHDKPQLPDVKQLSLSTMDVMILHQLKCMAKEAQVDDLLEIVSTMLEQTLQILEKAEAPEKAVEPLEI